MKRHLILVAGALAFALAGCSTSVAGVPSASPGPAPSAPAATAAAAAPPAPAAAEPGKPTPTGTKLGVGSPATVLYATDSTDTATTSLEVVVKSIEPGAIEDLSNFDLDAQAKQGAPFYATVSFRNTGTVAMDPGGIFGLINGYNAEDDKVSRLSLIGSFKKCDGIPPDTLAPGESFTNCEVYIAPKGQQVRKIEFGFYVGSKRTEITWSL